MSYRRRNRPPIYNVYGQCGVGTRVNIYSPFKFVDSNGSAWDTSMDLTFSSVTSNDNGLYTIRRSDMSTLQVYCDFSDPDESWTMLYVDFEFEIIACVFEHESWEYQMYHRTHITHLTHSYDKKIQFIEIYGSNVHWINFISSRKVNSIDDARKHKSSLCMCE